MLMASESGKSGLMPQVKIMEYDEQGRADSDPLFWKVGFGGKASWLFGTIHIPDRRFEEIPRAVLDAIDSCDAFCCEMEPDAQNRAELSGGMSLPDGETLSDVIGAELFSRLAAAAASFDVPIPENFLDRCRPWAALLLISYPKRDYDITLDTILYRKAKLLRKPVRGLETPREQIGTLESFTIPEQIALLKEAIAEAEDGYKTTWLILEDYMRNDIPSMMRRFLGRQSSISEDLREKYLERLLSARNQIFCDRLFERMHRESVFAAVGAGHLAGENGVQYLLEAKGCCIEPAGV